MYLSIALGLFIASIVAHELGHAVVMKKYGLALQEAGLGLPWGPHITLPRKWFAWVDEGFEVRIYLLLLGAYVKQKDESALLALSLEKKAHIFGAGIIANMYFAFGCLIALLPFLGADGNLHLRFGTFPIWHALSLGAIIVALLYVFPRKICTYIFPLLSVAVSVWVVWFFVGMTSDQVIQNSGGILVVGQLANKVGVNLPMAIFFGGVISLVLGVGNLLPVYFVDGGMIITFLLDRWLPSVVPIFQRVGAVIFFALLVLAMMGDAYHLFHPIK